MVFPKAAAAIVVREMTAPNEASMCSPCGKDLIKIHKYSQKVWSQKRNLNVNGIYVQQWSW